MSAPAPNPNDHAIVIAIRRYADVEAGWITTLEGPDNDAAAVADWLRAPEGGGLPPENVRVIASANVPDPFPESGAEPNQQGVIKALDEIAQLPKDWCGGHFAGRRLYVHISGHGWAREPDEAALITAEAKLPDPVNVLVTSWMRWMHKAAPFKELVLWADTCATREPLKLLQPCVLDESVSADHAEVRVFEGFAAPLGYRAVENTMPDGKFHGVFTYALLQGLNGAAPSPVTSDTLRDYLHNAMKDFMSDDQRKSRIVAQEPSFGRVDPIVFPTRPRPTFPVTLQFAQEHVGRRVFVATKRQDPPVDETVLETTEWTAHVEPGFWGVFIEGTDISKGIEVAGGGANGAIPVP